MKAAFFHASKSTVVILGSVLLGLLIFALSPGPIHFLANPTNWELREQLVFLTGACSTTLMVVSMILSARFSWVSKVMEGLDKGYVVHKWTGIFSTVFITAHFLMENTPKWLVESGLIKNPGELTDASQYSALEINIFQIGVLLIQPAFYVMLLLIVIALFKRIPYHWFRKTHKFFPVVFIIAVYHAATAQLKEHWFGSPGSFLLMSILSIGIVAAITSLFRNIGAKRRVNAKISAIELHRDEILDLTLSVGNNFKYQPGQYVFLKFPHSDEPHPFSIASSDDQGGTLRFAIKGLGDFTSKLPNHLAVGQQVKIEGPYGEFHFNDHCKRQVWIAGGIGITPFMARLEYLINRKTNQPIDFWYATRNDKNESFPSSLESSCRLSGVTFYHLNSTKKEYLTAALIKSQIGDLSNVSIWFCGPNAFAECIKQGLKSTEFDMRNFHFDSFSMR